MPTRTKSRAEIVRAVDRQLERYRSMRDFQITSEPKGSGSGAGPLRSSGPQPFVVQKHAATRLHYDFRLGWNGVLKSWAVTKGPSYFLGDKRLAVQVEDHPMEYGGFEGTIPKGQYGGGTVMIWDFGDWKPIGDFDREFEKGNLKFELHGTKLRGKWALIRMHKNLDRSDKPGWLLIKERDEYARAEDAPAITDEEPNSAVTKRTMEQIAESKDHVWDSSQGLLLTNNSEQQSSARNKKSSVQRHRAIERSLHNAPREAFPGFVRPQLAQEAAKAPNSDEWVHELKLDGYRLQVHVPSKKNRGKARTATLFTRTGLDWTARMPDLAAAAAKLDVEDGILDGEVVVLDDEGRANFSNLQAAFQEDRQKSLIYFAFDLLHLNGHNLCKLPLLQRKAILAELLSGLEPGSPIRLSEHIEGRGGEVFAKACELGAEGIISKLTSAPYTSGRGGAWRKLKCGLQQEFVIGGFTLPEKGGRGIGALLLGYYVNDKLNYAGRCGTGFTEQTHRTLRDRLDALEQKRSDFFNLPADAQRKVIWVKPKLVAQVSFLAWTRDDLVRQASFKGLREDKPPREVTRELAITKEPSLDTPASRSKHPTIAQDKSKPSGNSLGGFRITHPQRIIDQKSGATKLNVAEYYFAIADRILPQVSDRPLSVVRCPEGIGEPCFFQKHMAPGLSDGINSISIANRKTGKKEQFLTVNTVGGLLALIQFGVLEIHPWGSRNDSIEKPDRIIFDLDPDEAVPWATLASAAQELRAQLKRLRLTSFLKTTGGKGLHVVAPIESEHEWPVIKQFAHALVRQMEKSKPEIYITRMTKADRANKIYLDYLRNDREATAIAAYSTRSRPGIPVAVPLDWKDLEVLSAPRFYLLEFAQWKKHVDRNPWKAMPSSHQQLTVETLRAVGVKV